MNEWKMQEDQRHADIIIENMSLREAKGVSSACEEEQRREDEKNRATLDDKAGRKYHKLPARANYLAHDRSDLHYAVEQICKGL